MTRRAAPLAVAWTPIVVATARALWRDWLPMGDNAYFAIRARDVLTDHHPLVGAWSSGSDTVGVDVNNLGPVQLDLLALPVRLLGLGPGTAIGVAVVNLAAVTAVVVLLDRRLGALGAWAGAAMATATAWTLGSELLFEPRQHHAMVLPFLAVLVSSWALAAGDRWAAPVVVAFASLVAQTHLTFVVPALAVIMASALAAIVTCDHRGWRAPALVAAGVAVILWCQPLTDQLVGEGNLINAIEAARADRESIGVGRGLRVTADVLLPPAGWWRGSFRRFDPMGDLPSSGAATVGLALVVAVLAALGVAARRRRDRGSAAWSAIAVVSLGAAALTAASSPAEGPFGPVSGNFRYLWPVAVFTTAGILVAALRAAPASFGRAGRVGLPVLAALLALAALPTSYQSPGPERDAPFIPVARSLVAQARDVDDIGGPVLIDRRGLFFGEPYSYVVVSALQAEGVDLRFATRTDLARFGDDRRATGDEMGTLTLVTGDGALEDPGAGRVLLARASLLDGDAREELRALEASDDADLSLAEAARRDHLRDQADRGTVAVWLAPRRPEATTSSIIGSWGTRWRKLP